MTKAKIAQRYSYTCKWCEWTWESKVRPEDGGPSQCPGCRTTFWDTERQYKRSSYDATV